MTRLSRAARELRTPDWPLTTWRIGLRSHRTGHPVEYVLTVAETPDRCRTVAIEVARQRAASEYGGGAHSYSLTRAERLK